MQLAADVRKVLTKAYSMDFDTFCGVMRPGNSIRAWDKWLLMQDDFMKWYCTLDDELAERFCEWALKQDQIFIPVKPLTKEQMDIQLIEACILEKWNPMAMGYVIDGRASESCVLCQVYNKTETSEGCSGCPVSDRTGRMACYGTPYVRYDPFWLQTRNYKPIEDEIEFLISLLPEDHQWRNEK